MNIVFSPFKNIEVYLFAIGWLIALTTYTCQFYRSPGARQQVYLQLSKIACLVLLLLLNEQNSVNDKIFFFLAFKGVMLLIPVFWFWLVWRISRPSRQLPISFKYCYLVIIAFIELLLFTTMWHGMIWQGFWLIGKNMVGISGIFSWSEIISCLLCLLTLYLNFHWIVTSRGIRRKQAVCFFLAGNISFVGMTSDALFLTHFTPWVTLITSACITWCFYRYQLYNIFELAQKVVADDALNGWLLVDEYGYIIDINHVAQKILKNITVHIGVEFKNLIKEWPLLAKVQEENKAAIETVCNCASGRCYYEIKKFLLEKNALSFGQIILFQDVTLKKKT